MAASQTRRTNKKISEEAALPADDSPEVPSAFSLFKPSWEGLQQNLLELIVIYAVPTIALIILYLLAAGGSTHANQANYTLDSGHVVLFLIAIVATIVYAALVGPAILHIQLKSSRGEKATYASAWATSKKFWWRFILLSIMVFCTIFIGLLLLIVPGIIFLRRYYLSHYALIDQDLGVTESMQKSSQLSHGRSMAIFGVFGVQILISIPDIIPVIGPIITFILQIAFFCAPAIRYQQLKALKPVSATSTV